MASNAFYELLNQGTIDGLEPNAIAGTSLAISGNGTVGGTLVVTGAITATAGVAGAVSGNVTGDLTGNVTGDVSGNVVSNSVAIGGGAAITKVLTASATLDFASIAAAGSEDKTITVTGAAVGDPVALSLPAAIDAGLVFNAFVSAANTVTVRATNASAGAIDAASASFRVAVIHF
jgi:hypothetical protein